MSISCIRLGALCLMVSLVAFSNQARSDDGGYHGFPTASYSEGPPPGITYGGSFMWDSGLPAINWIEADIVDQDGRVFRELGALDFNLSIGTRTVTIPDTFTLIGPGTYRVRVRLYHNEGGTLKRTADSNSVTIPGGGGGGPGEDI